MKIVGNSKQDGIPKPDNPVQITNETVLIITDKEGNKKEMPFKYEKILKEGDKIEKIDGKCCLVRRKPMNDIGIFKILEDIIKGDEDCIKTISCGLNNQKNDEDVEHYKREIEAIINIVNLYKKEKARADKLEKEYSQMLTKIDNLEQIEQEHKEENGRLRDRIKELEGIIAFKSKKRKNGTMRYKQEKMGKK